MRFRNIDISDDGPEQVDGKFEIEKLRSLVGVELPKTFEEFLQVAGGRAIYEYGFKIQPFTGTFAFPIIYSLTQGIGEYFLVEQLWEERRKRGIPNEVIPFACVINGPYEGVIFLDLTDDGKGKVLVFVVGKPAWVGRNTEDAWLEVAESFDSYLELLELSE